MTLGPFVDAGAIGGIIGDPASRSARGWLVDAGGRATVGLLGGPALNFSWGQDLRTGRDAFYVTVTR